MEKFCTLRERLWISCRFKAQANLYQISSLVSGLNPDFLADHISAVGLVIQIRHCIDYSQHHYWDACQNILAC